MREREGFRSKQPEKKLVPGNGFVLGNDRTGEILKKNEGKSEGDATLRVHPDRVPERPKAKPPEFGGYIPCSSPPSPPPTTVNDPPPSLLCARGRGRYRVWLAEKARGYGDRGAGVGEREREREREERCLLNTSEGGGGACGGVGWGPAALCPTGPGGSRRELKKEGGGGGRGGELGTGPRYHMLDAWPRGPSWPTGMD